MTAVAEKVAGARRRSEDGLGYLDEVFAKDFRNLDCLQALQRAQAQFCPSFPGWALYRRVLTGDALLDRTLEAYAIGMARALSRAYKSNGRTVTGPATRRGAWVAQAGRDGLDYALFGRFAESLDARAKRFDVAPQTYRRIRDPVAGGIWVGIATFQASAHYEYMKLMRQKFGSGNWDG